MSLVSEGTDWPRAPSDVGAYAMGVQISKTGRSVMHIIARAIAGRLSKARSISCWHAARS